MRKILLLIPILFTGCAWMTPKIQIVEVKIPVAVVPAPPAIKRPPLEIERVSIAKNGYDGYVKALESDMIRMQTYTFNLENIIDTYSKLSKKLDEVNAKDITNGNPK